VKVGLDTVLRWRVHRQLLGAERAADPVAVYHGVTAGQMTDIIDAVPG